MVEFIKEAAIPKGDAEEIKEKAKEIGKEALKEAAQYLLDKYLGPDKKTGDPPGPKGDGAGSPTATGGDGTGTGTGGSGTATGTGTGGSATGGTATAKTGDIVINNYVKNGDGVAPEKKTQPEAKPHPPSPG